MQNRNATVHKARPVAFLKSVKIKKIKKSAKISLKKHEKPSITGLSNVSISVY